MEIIDGRLTAEKIKNNLATEISELKKTTGRIPGLVTILVGENPASQVYVKMKNKACAKIGMHSEQLNLPKEISENELLEIIEKYNRDDNFNGILVQLPL
ncbi:MAG: bifunctional 5,10-methylene-tetrahydrofolate dehydrogenase/5,10-methylene-tetrahydrofolate cyclohydrolase, partial [Melioribacteraceae bacterium]|nr:bifunctional 5,10-methylene-tetrahydrofolate dehydrogenase/5,10-methylene-tetrahydrofolate cyclohydrolase [Melioribacteraceae bacterium]